MREFIQRELKILRKFKITVKHVNDRRNMHLDSAVLTNGHPGQNFVRGPHDMCMLYIRRVV